VCCPLLRQEERHRSEVIDTGGEIGEGVGVGRIASHGDCIGVTDLGSVDRFSNSAVSGCIVLGGRLTPSDAEVVGAGAPSGESELVEELRQMTDDLEVQ
jgi:hypothetical protein